jgi:hypothetical protein
MPERPKGADCKSAGNCLRRFKSFSRHGSPIHKVRTLAPLAQQAERLHGKEEVCGSIPQGGSGDGQSSLLLPEAA